MINCLICKKEIENLDPDGNHPNGGTEFSTQGHYGSAVSDFCDGTRLVVNICDPCLLAADKEGIVLVIDPPKAATATARKQDVAIDLEDRLEVALDEIAQVTAENGKLRHAFRVNILRLAPGTSHAEIDDLLAALKDTTPAKNHVMRSEGWTDF